MTSTEPLVKTQKCSNITGAFLFCFMLHNLGRKFSPKHAWDMQSYHNKNQMSIYGLFLFVLWKYRSCVGFFLCLLVVSMHMGQIYCLLGCKYVWNLRSGLNSEVFLITMPFFLHCCHVAHRIVELLLLILTENKTEL